MQEGKRFRGAGQSTLAHVGCDLAPDVPVQLYLGLAGVVQVNRERVRVVLYDELVLAPIRHSLLEARVGQRQLRVGAASRRLRRQAQLLRLPKADSLPALCVVPRVVHAVRPVPARSDLDRRIVRRLRHPQLHPHRLGDSLGQVRPARPSDAQLDPGLAERVVGRLNPVVLDRHHQPVPRPGPRVRAADGEGHCHPPGLIHLHPLPPPRRRPLQYKLTCHRPNFGRKPLRYRTVHGRQSLMGMEFTER